MMSFCTIIIPTLHHPQHRVYDLYIKHKYILCIKVTHTCNGEPMPVLQVLLGPTVTGVASTAEMRNTLGGS